MEKGEQTSDVSSCFSPKEIYRELMTMNGSVPQAFVRLDQEHSKAMAPTSSATDPSLSTVPIIDLKALFNVSSTLKQDDHILQDRLRRDVLNKMHSASKDWGLFLIINHGVDEHVLNKVKLEIEEFFKLPLEEKTKYKVKKGESEGYGQNLTSQALQQHQRLDWADRFYMITHPPSLRNPRLFPMLPPSLRESLEAYIEGVERVGKRIIGWMGEALGMTEQEVEEVFQDGMRSVRMTYYPPYPNPDQVVGITPHSDATLITLLLQLNGVGGLEVNKDGRWIPVHVPPHALVVNVGDILEIVSNGSYKSAEHRVCINSEKERLSVALFFGSKLDGQIGPSSSMISPTSPPLFKTIAMRKYVADYFTTNLDGKSYLDRMRMPDFGRDGHIPRPRQGA